MTNKAAVYARQWLKETQEAAEEGYFTFIQFFFNNVFSLASSSEVCSFVLKRLLADRARSVELLKIEAAMPSTKDPERFSFWVCFSVCILIDSQDNIL